MSGIADDLYIRAVRQFCPAQKSYAKGYFNREKRKFQYAFIRNPIADEKLLEHRHGKAFCGGVSADEEDQTSSVGLDVDSHDPEQKPEATVAKFVRRAKQLGVPVMVHRSKSGKGFHIRTLFDQPVRRFIARALYLMILTGASLNYDTSVDKVWPPTKGQGVLALPYSGYFAKKCGGTLMIDPISMEPYPAAWQVAKSLETPLIDENQANDILQYGGVRDAYEAAILAGTSIREAPQGVFVADQVDMGIEVMLSRCAACTRLNEYAETIPYAFWWSMMTNFKPFIGGKDLFHEYSKLDPVRYDARRLDYMWDAIKGKPKRCMNLDPDWKCPHIGVCSANAPAGLPRKLQRQTFYT